MPNLPSRVLAALPDAITTALFLGTWIAPAWLGLDYIGNLMMVMVVEFFVVHSSGFYAGILAATETARVKRVLAMLALIGVYGLFMLLFYAVGRNPWPIYAFLWLLASRFAHVLLAAADSEQEILRAVRLWAASVAAYVLGAIAAILLPLPALGVTPAVLAALPFDSLRDWSVPPHKVLAFGTLYFAVQSWAKFALSAPPARASARA